MIWWLRRLFRPLPSVLAGYMAETGSRYTDYVEVLFTAEERPLPTPPWWEQQFLGVPLWLWMVIGSGVLSVARLTTSVAFAIASRGR